MDYSIRRHIYTRYLLFGICCQQSLSNPQGQIDWRGLASQPIYIKDLLAKFGVKMQVVKVGAYKSATEMFTGDKMSEANREQTTAYLNSIWQNITNDVSKSRNIPAGKLNQYADSMMTLAPQEDYLKTKW